MKTQLRDLFTGIALVAALVVLAPIATAQGIYKFVDRDGHTVYTDDPTASRGVMERIEAPPQSSQTPTPVVKLSEAEKNALEQSQRRLAALDRANGDIIAAESAIRAAEARREQGVEPIEGERQGRRYRPEFWERQQALQRDIDDARMKLNDAIDRRNELR